MKPERLVFIDATWVSTNMAPRYDRGRKDNGSMVRHHPPGPAGPVSSGDRMIGLLAHHGHWKTTTFIAALRHDRIDAPCVPPTPAGWRGGPGSSLARSMVTGSEPGPSKLSHRPRNLEISLSWTISGVIKSLASRLPLKPEAPLSSIGHPTVQTPIQSNRYSPSPNISCARLKPVRSKPGTTPSANSSISSRRRSA